MMMRPSVTVLDAQPAAHSASPAVTFKLRLDVGQVRVHAMALRCHVQIDARRRPYDTDERRRLYELFGDASQFDRALRPITWSQSALVVPTFDGSIECDVPVACTYDLEVASGKYLHAVRDGDIPLLLQISGTIFQVEAGSMSIAPVPWDVEAAYRLPATVWRATMDQFFPGGGWVRLQSRTLDRLQAFRGRAAVVTWDEAVEQLLAASESSV